jgi:hypothetical protein
MTRTFRVTGAWREVGEAVQHHVPTAAVDSPLTMMHSADQNEGIEGVPGFLIEEVIVAKQFPSYAGHALTLKTLDRCAIRRSSLSGPVEDRGPTALLTMCPGYGTRGENQRMSDTPRNDKSKQQIRHLRELIAALDRRVPRIERVGEADIARDAAELKKKALTRLAELQADVEQE